MNRNTFYSKTQNAVLNGLCVFRINFKCSDPNVNLQKLIAIDILKLIMNINKCNN